MEVFKNPNQYVASSCRQETYVCLYMVYKVDNQQETCSIRVGDIYLLFFLLRRNMRRNTYFINEGKRIQLREKIINGVEKYNHFLVNKVFLVICEDGSEYTLRFLKSDFRHLTGVDTDLNDDAFFELCKSRRLDIGNINEYQKYNWATLKSKALRISQIHRLLYDNIQNTLFMINLHTNTRTFPVAVKNTNIDTCVGFIDGHKARTLRKYNNSNDADSQKKFF